MDNLVDNVTTVVDEDAFLPEGWAEGDDIFADPDTWTGAHADEQSEEGEETAEEATPAPTTEQEETGDAASTVEQEAPTTEPTAEQMPRKLKFRAKIDREDRDIELDESDLPSVYQRAQNHDRAQDKLARLNPLVANAEAMAKRMGYESLEDMTKKAEEKFVQTEVDRLVYEGVHEEVARDMVQRRLEHNNKQSEKPQEEKAAPTRAENARDFRAETVELLKARPDLQGKKLPDEVVKDCVVNGKNLLVAYAEHEARKEKAENESLKERLRILEQNEAAAAKAPVKGTTGGGATDTKADDPFLSGFDSDY